MRVDRWIAKRKQKFLAERPYLEWRLPVMMVAVSGMVFILLTAMFGVTYNIMTGEASFHFVPGDDWANPLVGKPGENNRTAVNPMSQYPWFCWLAMIWGYFFSVGLLIYFYFGYMRWRWEHVPEEIRYVEKRVRVKNRGTIFPMNGRKKT